MSLGLALNNALAGMAVSKTAIDVLSNNIANVNTPGYTRKLLGQESVVLGGQGAGVAVSNITRQVSDILIQDLRNERSTLGAAEAKDFFYARMQDLFGTPGSNSALSANVSEFAATLERVATTPESVTFRTQAVTAGVTLASRLNEYARQIQRLRVNAELSISDSVRVVNEQLGVIADLNKKIFTLQAIGQSTADLEDTRDQALQTVAEHMDIATFTRASGEVVVLTGTGQVLADLTASSLTYSPVGGVDASVTYPGGFGPISLNGVDLTTTIASGRIAALVNMRDGALPTLNAELDRLALSLCEEVNKIHNDGAGYPPAAALTGTTAITGGGAAAFSGTGTVRIAVVNSDGTFAAAPIDFNLASAATVGAVVTAINTALGADGTAALNASNQLVITATGAGRGIAINEGTSAVGGKGFSHYFGLNDLFVGSTTPSMAQQIAVRSDIVANPNLLSAGELSEITAGSVTVNATPAVTPGNNLVAQRLANKFNERLSIPAAGGLPASSSTFAEYASQIVALNSTKAKESSSRLSFEKTLFEDLSLRAGSFSGVNLDEELANLVVFENAYSASARVVTAIADMMKVLEELI
ncbi:MAG: flagellar hook-associated protein FlgK [Alphaproteobacteria bacterium]